ncbi:hypothetical protein J5069_15985 [Candidatus Symbiopectobacterium sp. NZEC127]|uniref:hypothetical protein n=1 Tax=Candidatus Symbiopectobacterium sp. NZEC127 TaxID=2820472 RepID=UPI00222764CE|nr:hypothetical protein [Candidatus Symbiopectobacterium sp. NZEC127]MCW2487399.1 hypothetical protein [Candidatus Symbiopectobacterium sp. NZEC127]
MRTISLAELPEECRDSVLIRSKNRKQQCRSQNAIEHTLRRCHEIYDEQKQTSEEIKKQKEKEGFSAGFKLCFTTMLSMLNDYETLQHQRWTEQRQHLQKALTQTLHDPIIVEYVVTQLNAHCSHSDAMTLILPEGVAVPDLSPHLTCLTTHENHITLQCGSHALRFPAQALCQQWMTQADSETQEFTQQLDALTPATLQEIIDMLRQAIPTFTYTAKDED